MLVGGVVAVGWGAGVLDGWAVGVAGAAVTTAVLTTVGVEVRGGIIVGEGLLKSQAANNITHAITENVLSLITSSFFTNALAT